MWFAFFNLSGKSMLLSAIGYREIPIPEHIDIYHLTREMAPSDKTALQCVMDVDQERIKLEKETERLAHEDCESCVAFYVYGKCSTKSNRTCVIDLKLKLNVRS